MARVKSEFVSAFKIAGNVFEKLANAVIDAGGNDEHLRRLETDDVLCAKIAADIVGSASVVAQAIIDTYHLVVNHGKTLKEMIATGHYDWVNSDITEANFPLDKGEGIVEMDTEVIHIGRDISSDDALKELDRRGYRAGTAAELLAFGATYPEKQREFPIVALGTVRLLDGYRRVLCLWDDRSERDLGLSWFDVDWDGRSRFLAVRK